MFLDHLEIFVTIMEDVNCVINFVSVLRIFRLSVDDRVVLPLPSVSVTDRKKYSPEIVAHIYN
jgi:hypothetical protein